jgi:acyl-coenzyme A synthetase/AMP-(fatty) acid ligase
VQVVDDTGLRLAPGEVGLIRVDALPGAASYYQDEEATRAWFRDGFFYSGDLGQIDADGRLTLHGRVSDVVPVRGIKIAAETIEAQIQRRLSVGAVGVFSTRGDGSGEELHVVFEAGQRPDVEVLKAMVLADLQAFPRVHFHQIDALPRNDRGKLQRFVLKQMILEIWTPRRGS